MLKTFLDFWDLRFDVIIVLLILSTAYVWGWLRLQKFRRLQKVNWLPLLFYLLGISVIAIALMSPIDSLQSLLFYMHMLQHELLIYLAPPLLLLGKPLPFVLWGLPRPLRKTVSKLFRHNSWLRRGLAFINIPVVAFLVSTAVLWLWHIPAAYNLALRNDFVHGLEHISFFLAFLFYWWPLIGSPPQSRRLRSNGSRGLYLLLGAIPTALLGAVIALSDSVIYTYYLGVPRINELTALADQQIGGAIMWLPGPLIYGLIAILTMKED